MMETIFTKEQFEDFKRYLKVQKSGKYNMFDPRAIALTGLTRKQYIFVIENYEGLSETADNN